MAKQKEIVTQVEMLTKMMNDADSASDARLRELVDAAKAEVLSSLDAVRAELQSAIDANNASLQATQTALEAVQADTTAASAACASLQNTQVAVEAVKSDVQGAIDAGNNAQQALKTIQSALDEAKAALEKADAALGATINTEKAALEQAIASIQQRVDALAATLSETQNTIQTTNASFALRTEVDDVLTKINDLAKSIAAIQATVDSNVLDAKGVNDGLTALNNRVSTVEAGVAGFQDKWVAFNGAAARVGKEGYVFDLVMTYADFDATMQDGYTSALARLVADAHLEEEAAQQLLTPVFESIRSSWSHVMLGYMHRGTALITLGETLAQSEDYKNEYIARLNSYLLFVEFEIHKAVVNYTIGIYTDTPAEANAYFFDRVAEIVYIQKTADVMGCTADVQAYFAGLIAALDAWQRRADGLNKTYGKLDEVKAAIVALTTKFITKKEQAKLIADLEAIVVDENYYMATDTQEDADAVATLVAKDAAAMDLIVRQATVYNEVMAYADAAKGKVQALSQVVAANKKTVKVAIDDAVTPLVTYRTLPAEAEIVATEAKDKTAIDLYVAQVRQYDKLLAYLEKQIAKVNGLAYLTEDEKATSIKVLSDVAVFGNYFSVLADADAIAAQYAADVAAMDLLCFKIDLFNKAEKYAADAKAAYGTAYDADAYNKEKQLVEGYIDAVSSLSTYLDATANGDVGVEDVVKDILAKDKVKVDVLTQRLATYKNVYDLVAETDAAIDAMDSKHDNGATGCGKAKHGVFLKKDKAAFKAKYVAFVARFDASVDAKAFVAVSEVKAYEASIRATVALVACNAATFCTVIKAVADAEDAIANLANINAFEAKSAATFCARFASYALYDTHEANTKDYATDAQFADYQAAVLAKVQDTVVIAQCEDRIVESVLGNKAEVTAAFDAAIVTDAEKAYLLNVLDSIYAARTNLSVDSTDTAKGNVDAADKEAAEVAAMTTILEDVNTKADVLNNVTIPAYLKTFKDNFYDNFYEDTYKDAQTVWNKYYNNTPYGKDALLVEEPVVVDAQYAYMVTIEAKVQSTLFFYRLPQEVDYAAFHAFKTYLESQDIPKRLSALHHWAETNYTETGVVDGGIFAKMTASFDALESKRLIQARGTFGKYLVEKLDEYRLKCVPKKSDLHQVYNLTIASIEVAPKTADVVSFYKSGCMQFERIYCLYELELYYNGLVEKAKAEGKGADLLATYKKHAKEISGLMDEKALATQLKAGKKALDAAVGK